MPLPFTVVAGGMSKHRLVTTIIGAVALYFAAPIIKHPIDTAFAVRQLTISAIGDAFFPSSYPPGILPPPSESLSSSTGNSRRDEVYIPTLFNYGNKSFAHDLDFESLGASSPANHLWTHEKDEGYGVLENEDAELFRSTQDKSRRHEETAFSINNNGTDTDGRIVSTIMHSIIDIFMVPSQRSFGPTILPNSTEVGLPVNSWNEDHPDGWYIVPHHLPYTIYAHWGWLFAGFVSLTCMIITILARHIRYSIISRYDTTARIDQARLTAAEQSISQMTLQNTNLQQTNADLQQDNNSLQRDLNEHQALLDSHESALVAKESTIRQLTSDLEASNSDRLTLFETIGESARTLVILSEQILTMRNEIGRLQRDLQAAKIERHQARNFLCASEMSREDLLKEIEDVRGELAEVKRSSKVTVAEKDVSISLLASEKEDLQNILATAEKDRDGLQAAITADAAQTEDESASGVLPIDEISAVVPTGGLKSNEAGQDPVSFP